ncbi:MAG: hypothetical protein SF339_16330 [Blastocatellia bacterium]|nr:hypothetical protein [Blastocatellia bacterium]
MSTLKANELQVVASPQQADVEYVKAHLEARVRAALEEAMTRPSQEIAEPEGWWNLFAIGPIQIPASPLPPAAPLLPHQVIKVGETAFVANVMVLNPFQIVGGVTNAATVLSNFALPYTVRYQTGNLSSWTLGQADMNVVHSGFPYNLVPGQFVYVDLLAFTASTPGIYEMNVSVEINGATPPYTNAPQFAGFARAVVDIDPELFIGGAPGLQFDQPIRFQIYP